MWREIDSLVTEDDAILASSTSAILPSKISGISRKKFVLVFVLVTIFFVDQLAHKDRFMVAHPVGIAFQKVLN